MKSLLAFIGGLAGLFFDDGSLALAVLVILVAASWLARSGWAGEGPAMALLLSGVLAALAENVMRTARKQGNLK